jgi:hypothetical protein
MSGSARGDEKPPAARRNWRSSPTLPFYASFEQRDKATLLASGDKDDIQWIKPVFDGLVRSWYFVGEFGNASRLKFIQNHQVTVHTAATAEAMALGVAAGLDPDLVYRMVTASGANSVVFQVRGKMMLDGDYRIWRQLPYPGQGLANHKRFRAFPRVSTAAFRGRNTDAHAGFCRRMGVAGSCIPFRDTVCGKEAG